MTSAGFASHSTSSVRPHFSQVPPFDDSTSTSAHFTICSRISLPSGEGMFSVIMRWLRRSTDHASPYMRYMSGATVLSSSMTSAPCSANSSQTNGAAMTAPALSTFKFCKLPNLGAIR